MCTKNQLNIILSTMKKEAERIFVDKLVDVILYGSYARGDYSSDSDIDIMVKVDMEQTQFSKYRWEISKISSELGLLYDVFISVHIQEDYRFEKFKESLPFYRNVLTEGISVYDR